MYSVRGHSEGGFFLQYNIFVMMSGVYPKDYWQFFPGRTEQKPKLSTTYILTNNNLTLLCLNVLSLNRHLEDLEALVYSLECHPRFLSN